MTETFIMETAAVDYVKIKIKNFSHCVEMGKFKLEKNVTMEEQTVVMDAVQLAK